MSVASSVGRRIAFLAVAAIVLWGTFEASSTRLAAQGQERAKVLITFANQPGPFEQALVRGMGGQIRHTYHLVPGMAASLPTTAVAALRNNPNVLAVEPDIRAEAIDAELDLAWGVKRIGAGTVQAGGVTGAGVKVAVIDTGIDYTHPELAGVYQGGWDFVNNDNDPFDDHWHGTHVSGTIAAADNNTGVVGVAPGVSLYALKVLDQNGSGDFGDIIAALQWAVDAHIQVTNNSYGSSGDPGTLVAQAFSNAAAAGLVDVAAAGNSGNCGGKGNSVGYPARYDSVIAVGATNSSDSRPCFSSTGPAVEVAAPGESIASTYPGGQYAYASGTSMASPHVAGLAALLFSAGAPDAGTVRSVLDSTADDLGASGRDNLYGFGLVNAVAAVGAVASAGPPPAAVHVVLSTDKSTYDQADSTALLTVSVTNETGAAIAGLGSGAFVTTLDGNGATADFSETSTPGTYAAALDISGAAAGQQHSVTVQVTNGGVNGSDTKTFAISSSVQSGTVSISSIDYGGRGGRDGMKNLFVTLTAVDGASAPVPNAIVDITLYLNDSAIATGQGTTDSQGHVTFQVSNAAPGVYRTTVTAVTASGLTWDGSTPPNSFTKN